jgi:hypothetical protein
VNNILRCVDLGACWRRGGVGLAINLDSERAHKTPSSGRCTGLMQSNSSSHCRFGSSTLPIIICLARGTNHTSSVVLTSQAPVSRSLDLGSKEPSQRLDATLSKLLSFTHQFAFPGPFLLEKTVSAYLQFTLCSLPMSLFWGSFLGSGTSSSFSF